MVGITRTEATHISVVFSAGLTNVQLRIQATCFQTFVKSSILDCNIQGGAMEGVIEPHFTCLFVDEAAQATKPETLIPLSVVAGDPIPENTKVEIVLAGDPRQLSPNVCSIKAAECGLKTTFLERLLQRPISALGGGHPHMLGLSPKLDNVCTIQDGIQYSFQKEGQDYLNFFDTQLQRTYVLSHDAEPLFYFDKLQGAKTTNGYPKQVLRASQALSTPVQLQEVELPSMLQPLKPR
eukprot:CAMPEP_0202487988 /NCGR_PEP_ID=MMETSP1361-20130828/6156_1 /ASSEMBLY_ACC=CAM_ASM_000849 /TAXON_ID=210615 /ORGANISM="Staurosira complex sp., Strain CCMP2646" /LENGTH=236 /DNA_ID=CAMNT_0049117475 /DNA_START=343 /DNA_END=1055 /DNA_ORIENTATION=+